MSTSVASIVVVPHYRIRSAVLACCMLSPLLADSFPSDRTDANGNTIFTNSAGKVTYQFLVSGYPAANECKSFETDASSLETSTRTKSTAASSLEARYRTWMDSDGIALRSDRFRFFGIVIR